MRAAIRRSTHETIPVNGVTTRRRSATAKTSMPAR
jgi:hypothetical protein